jgi:hypothetical protein
MRAFFLAACLIAGLTPLTPWKKVSAPVSPSSWPDSFEGVPLVPVALSEHDARFMSGFPGQVSAFLAGGKRVLMRRIDEPTRALHPAADCYRGLGFETKSMSSIVGPDGARWSRFEAIGDGERLIVRERIFTSSGESWTDASSWYWFALLGSSRGPWFAVTVAEHAP